MKPSLFSGIPRYQSTALPPHGQTMIRCRIFTRLLYPARFCTRVAIGEALRTGRVE